MMHQIKEFEYHVRLLMYSAKYNSHDFTPCDAANQEQLMRSCNMFLIPRESQQQPQSLGVSERKCRLC